MTSEQLLADVRCSSPQQAKCDVRNGTKEKSQSCLERLLNLKVMSWHRSQATRKQASVKMRSCGSLAAMVMVMAMATASLGVFDRGTSTTATGTTWTRVRVEPLLVDTRQAQTVVALVILQRCIGANKHLEQSRESGVR